METYFKDNYSGTVYGFFIPFTSEAAALKAMNRAGINTNSGIGYCNGDKDFYIELLTSFVDGANSKESELGNFFDYSNINLGILEKVYQFKIYDTLVGEVEDIQNDLVPINSIDVFLTEYKEYLLNINSK